MRSRRHLVVAVSRETQRTRFLGELLVDTDPYNVFVVESLEHAYARIKREKPDLVVLYVAVDDAAVCRLLSMLTLDPETSAIPIVTWTERFDGHGLNYCLMPDAPYEAPVKPAAVRMN
jgi:DNA-binding response OmpR family regulator